MDRSVSVGVVCEVGVGDIPALRTLFFLIDLFFSVDEISLVIAASTCDGVTPADKVLVRSRETTTAAGFDLVLGFVTALGLVLGFEEAGFEFGFDTTAAAVVVVVVELAVIGRVVAAGGRPDGTICPCKCSPGLSSTTAAPSFCTGICVKSDACDLESGAS